MTTASPSSKCSPEVQAAIQKLLPLLFKFNRLGFTPTAEELAESLTVLEETRDLLRREIPGFRE